MLKECFDQVTIPIIAPQNAKPFLSDESSAYKSLDVRQIWEGEKAYVAGSIHVPLFVEAEATDVMTLLKSRSSLASVAHGLDNDSRNRAPMMAIESLRKAGYAELAWLGGGFNNVRDGDFVTVENGTKLQWATVGGASELFLKFAVLLSGVSNSISGSSPVKDK